MRSFYKLGKKKISKELDIVSIIKKIRKFDIMLKLLPNYIDIKN
jgi:hypothetical protein